MNTILEITEATKLYGGLAANEGITFDVKEGEIVGVVGPNGAGKTTLFNSVSGAHNLTRGSIIYNGTNITNLKAHAICKLGIGRTFQIPQSLNEMTVWKTFWWALSIIRPGWIRRVRRSWKSWNSVPWII